MEGLTDTMPLMLVLIQALETHIVFSCVSQFPHFLAMLYGVADLFLATVLLLLIPNEDA